MTATIKTDPEMERFIRLGTKIAARLKKKGIELKLHIAFGPVPKPEKRKVLR